MSVAIHRALFALGAILALHGARAREAEPAVEVFTLSTLPLTNVGTATVHYVDAVALLEQHLSVGLPPDPVRAQQLVAQRIAALGPELKTRVRSGASGLARAAQLGVHRAPAVIFEGRWAVYGITDVEAARRIFARRPPERRS